MSIISPIFLWGDMIWMIHYVKKKILVSKVERASINSTIIQNWLIQILTHQNIDLIYFPFGAISSHDYLIPNLLGSEETVRIVSHTIWASQRTSFLLHSHVCSGAVYWIMYTSSLYLIMCIYLHLALILCCGEISTLCHREEDSYTGWSCKRALVSMVLTIVPIICIYTTWGVNRKSVDYSALWCNG